ncbi:4804_t:CDS:10, partial [Acaulospora morrowiae]
MLSFKNTSFVEITNSDYTFLELAITAQSQKKSDDWTNDQLSISEAISAPRTQNRPMPNLLKKVKKQIIKFTKRGSRGAPITDLTEEYTVQSSSIVQEDIAQSTSSRSIITTREPDKEPSTNIPEQPETNAMAQNTQDTTAEDTTAQNITSTLDALHLDPPITPPETVESLRAYEKEPGEAQKFLDRMEDGFTWPASMPDNIRRQVFWGFTDDVDAPEGDLDRETAANFLYFFNSLDKGMFDEHQKDWVLVYGQKVVKYGSDEYTNQQLSDLEDEMPGAIYIPVDPLLREKYFHPVPAARAVKSQRSNYGEHLLKVRVKRVGSEDQTSVILDYQFYEPLDNNKLYKTVLDTGAPETILPFNVRRRLGKSGWYSSSTTALGYGAPARLILAHDPFLVSIGDDNGWSNWVQTNTLRVWESKPGDQITYHPNDSPTQDFIQEVSSGFTDEEIIEVIDVLTTNTTIEVELAHLFLKFEIGIQELMVKENISEQTARKRLFQDIIKHLSGITLESLRKRTQRSIKLYKLIEKIGVDKIKNIKTIHESEKVRPKVPLDQNDVVNHVSNTESTDIISRADMIKQTSSIAQKSVPPIFEPEVD